MTSGTFRFLALSALMLLSSCKYSLPDPVSGVREVADHQSPVHEIALTEGELRALAVWFSVHADGWSSSPATYVPTALIRVKDGGGDVSVVNVMQKQVVVNNRKGQFVRQISEDEGASLRQSVGMPIG